LGLRAKKTLKHFGDIEIPLGPITGTFIIFPSYWQRGLKQNFPPKEFLGEGVGAQTSLSVFLPKERAH